MTTDLRHEIDDAILKNDVNKLVNILIANRNDRSDHKAIVHAINVVVVNLERRLNALSELC